MRRTPSKLQASKQLHLAIAHRLLIMKAFAIHYKLVDGARVDIQFGGEPSLEFRYTTRELAAADCVRLNQVEPQTNSHCCAFAVEQLSEGDFGIICACHPDMNWLQKR